MSTATAALLATAHLKGPHVDFAALSPLIALLGGAIAALMGGLVGPQRLREHVTGALALTSLGAALGLSIWRWGHHASAVSGALRIDELSLVVNFVLVAGGAASVLLAWREHAAVAREARAGAETGAGAGAETGARAGAETGAGAGAETGARAGAETGAGAGADSSQDSVRDGSPGELYGLLLTTIAGMSLLAAAQNTVALFLGLELLSIPLYVLCASQLRRERSLESGLKYLIIGSVGSATLLYGLALAYGATGATDFAAIADAISAKGLAENAMLLTGIALCVAGLCFKASVAPFHQWTPDVYEGAPTPVTAFMAVATKVAALGVLLRLFDVAFIDAQPSWGPALAALATVTIVVGNVGALGQSSMKRMLAYSSVAQSGYMLAGVVVSTELGARALVFYLAVYAAMNMAAFAVVVARERETELGDSVGALAGLGRSRPWLAWPMTVSMLALAGIPATGGFIGKFYLIDAAVSGGYTWLGVVIVVGSMISLGYYLPVVAAMWMREAPAPAIAGASQELDAAASGPERHWEPAFVAVLAGAATVLLGIVPQPLFDLVRGVGRGLGLF